jgi:hypothetical protein
MKQVVPQVSDEDIVKASAVLKDSDSVELKLTVQESDHRSAIMELGMDVLNAEFRQVVFFDTPDLKLSKGGLVVRARRIRGGGDSVVKLRPVVPEELSRKLRQKSGFNLEVDAMPGTFVCSGSLKAKADNSDVNLVLLAKLPIRKLFSDEQRTFYKKYAPKGLDLNRLAAFGPINVAKLKFKPEHFTGSFAAEVWFYPDGSRILELSTKCAPNEAFQVVAEMRAFLKRHGISITANQETKTRKALEYFSRLHHD